MSKKNKNDYLLFLIILRNVFTAWGLSNLHKLFSLLGRHVPTITLRHYSPKVSVLGFG